MYMDERSIEVARHRSDEMGISLQGMVHVHVYQ